MFKRMVLKMVLGAVQRLENAMKKRSAENPKRIIDSCNGSNMRFILIR
jgi:hypothetical protein